MNVLDVFRALRRYWWVVAVITLAVAIPAYVVADGRAPVYEASSRFVIAPEPLDNDADLVGSTAALDRGAFSITFAELMRASGTLDRAADELDLTDVVARYEVSASVVPEAKIVELRVTGPDPETVHVLTTQLGDEAMSRFSSLYPIYRAHLLNEPRVPSAPIGADPLQDAVIIAIAGVLVGVITALSLDRARRRRIRLTDVEGLTLRLREASERDEPLRDLG